MPRDKAMALLAGGIAIMLKIATNGKKNLRKQAHLSVKNQY
jgi:hypothetical protein